MKLTTAIYLASALWLTLLTNSRADPIPLPRAHAHNDYEHARPLLDALDHGFCGIEADVYLVDGKLLVAHDRSKVTPNRTLELLYLDPLRDRVRQNGGRVYPRVYPNGPVVTLLVDIKSDAESTYKVLKKVLQQYADILTIHEREISTTKAVHVIISGNRPRATMAMESVRLAGVDGRIPDLESGDSAALIPLISDNWTQHFKWNGQGEFPDAEKQKLHRFVERAHSQQRKIRFWGTPDTPIFWKELYEAGVDLINTDNLAGLKKFLSNR
jgi:glycerophosphoryl diester phosphodiesterase